jgi:hypothetical protein
VIVPQSEVCKFRWAVVSSVSNKFLRRRHGPKWSMQRQKKTFAKPCWNGFTGISIKSKRLPTCISSQMAAKSLTPSSNYSCGDLIRSCLSISGSRAGQSGARSHHLISPCYNESTSTPFRSSDSRKVQQLALASAILQAHLLEVPLSINCLTRILYLRHIHVSN